MHPPALGDLLISSLDRIRAAIVLLMLGITGAAGCVEGSGSNSVRLRGKVTEYVPGSAAEGLPIAEVLVCQFASNNCALTNDNGDYALLLLMNREVEISYVKDGFGPVLVARRSGVDDFAGDAKLATNADLLDFAALLDTPYPPAGTGYLSMTAYRGPISDGTTIAGVAYSLTGSNGRAYYLDDSGAPDTSLTETQAPGKGGFVEIAPVTVNLQVSGPVANCTSKESWGAAATNTFKLPIRAGFWTQSKLSCE